MDPMIQDTTTETNRSAGAQARLSVDGKYFSRATHRVRFHGVIYGPFVPNAEGHPFPSPNRVNDDFALMRQIGFNALRTYHLPPEWFLDLAEKYDLSVLIDIPWPKHLCFLDTPSLRVDIRSQVREAARRGRNHASVLAYSIGNEIPFDIVRWYGAARIERFVAELMDVSKQVNPNGLVTYANYPPTEYLDLTFLDFVMFNVYLHDRETFSRYLFRLQNLVGDKPLVLGELGMDTLRHGELEQAQFLAGHLREATLIGLAGSFIFSWTDDWYTGGCRIDNWAFGITRADRSPKMSYHVLGDVLESSPAALLRETLRVSVVVCSYNGGQTLEQCLHSLLALEYPDYEIILVDDGSTDDTRAIAEQFPTVRAIHQENGGLSAARNVGLRAATGSIIAYTDSDCFVDPHWLTHLVYQLQRTDAAAVGGPNLTPEDGWIASCVAVSPGQPTHVLESDQVAEHIPGCNMAFRREALEAVNGFDPVYQRAGDDVDICWRLQQADSWITFAPGAFVWHHRRHSLRGYLKQQVGYGEAEALLQFKHPERFTILGSSKWRGVVYGQSLPGLRLGKSVIYRGTFGTGLFQCLYQPGPAAWSLLPSTLEWHGLSLLIGLGSYLYPPVWILMVAMLGLSLTVAALQAAQAQLPAKHKGFKSRLIIALLFYIQPLVRSWKRYAGRVVSYRHSPDPALLENRSPRLPLRGVLTESYWTEAWQHRTQLLDSMVAYLSERRWAKNVDPGWSDWDIEMYCHLWTALQIRTVQEDHGGGKRLIRVQYRLRLTKATKTLAVLGAIASAVLTYFHKLPAAVAVLALITLIGGFWWRGAGLAARAVAAFDAIARGMRFIRCEPSRKPAKKLWVMARMWGGTDAVE
ncbi:MAG: glycosyltransferase [Acidobacteria bacterium]|nr:glycosyltransferase [Acidobacteriota bacterium]